MQESTKIRRFPGSAALSPLLERLAQLPEIEAVVIGRDYHEKKKPGYTLASGEEIPSSSAIVSRTHIFPRLMMNAGCGMMTFRIKGFFEDGRTFSREDFLAVTKDIIGGFFYHAQFKFGVRLPLRRNGFDIRDDALFDAACAEGAEFVNRSRNLRLDLSKTEAHAGAELTPEERTRMKELLFIAPEERRFVMARMFFGTYFGGNHFFEFQKAVGNDQDLYISLHTGGDEINRIISPSSPLAPLFSDPQATPLSAQDDRAQDILLLNRVATNFSYAARLNALALTADSLKRHGFPYECEVLSHSSHNGTTSEVINREQFFVYRHNAVQTAPGRTGFLSGFYDTYSYLYGPGPSASEYFNTMDHGMKAFTDAHGLSAGASVAGDVPLLRVKRSVHWPPYRSWSSSPRRYSGKEFVQPLEEAGIITVDTVLYPIYNLKT